MRNLTEKLRDMGPKAILVVLAAVMVLLAIVAAVVIGTIETRQAKALRQSNERIRMEEVQGEQAELTRLDEIFAEAKRRAGEAMPGFLLLGDDLTAGSGVNRTDYGVALQQMISNEILNTLRLENAVAQEYRRVVRTNEKRYVLPTAEIKRYGIPGASTATILAMDGAYPILLAAGGVTVPAECEDVQIRFLTARGDYIYPLIGGSRRNEQVLLYDETSGARLSGVLSALTTRDPVEYLFRRDEAGEETVFPEGTRVYTRQSRENRNLFPIIWMGMNGGYDSIEELIEQHRALLSDKALYADGYYLIVGLLDSTAAEEAAFEAAFGEHYLNARKYLNEHGLNDAGLTPTDADRTAVQNGEVPVSLRDLNNAERTPFYLNRDGYAVIGREIFRRIDALGYFDGLRGVIADAMAEASGDAD